MADAGVAAAAAVDSARRISFGILRRLQGGATPAPPPEADQELAHWRALAATVKEEEQEAKAQQQLLKQEMLNTMRRLTVVAELEEWKHPPHNGNAVHEEENETFYRASWRG